MPQDDRQAAYRQLPSVHELLERPRIREWTGCCRREIVVGEVRAILDEIRQGIAEDGRPQGPAQPPSDLAEWIEGRVSRRLDSLRAGSLRRVINATGVILHTNLGRAPLSQRAVEAIQQTAGGYSNLEYDLAAGRRGKRDVHAGDLLERLLGAPAIVVNNNAAAVFLVLNEWAAGGNVIVSRGELIEIGDGFRIPDIMVRSGARLKEVGTTNRTRIEDYRGAIDDAARLLLRVHHSNFRIVGFTARPTLEEMAALARETDLPLIEDLGSGCLYDLSSEGFDHEPRVQESLQAGVDLVTFSGDKLLGGSQAGVIAGKPDAIQRVRRNPLFRALRVDKLTYAALGATLSDYLLGRYDDIPVLRMIRTSLETIRARAAKLVERLPAEARAAAEITEGESVLGGGSTPAQSLPTMLIRWAPPPGVSAAALERRLRRGRPPVIVRIEEDRLAIDLRTVSPEEEDDLLGALERALGLEVAEETAKSTL